MRAEEISDTGVVVTPRRRIAVVAALAMERTCLDSLVGSGSGSLVDLHQSGIGRDNARRTARAALDGGAAGMISWGFAGGLEWGLAAGTVLLPGRLLGGEGREISVDAPWQARLVAALEARFQLHTGDLLEVDRVLATPAQKARSRESSGAVAVDMESATLAETAGERGVPFVAVRVVADGPADALPPRVERWIDVAGNHRLSPALDAALRPAQWRALITMGHRYRKARRTLIALARQLVPLHFLFQ